jgi:peptidyl-prolyl cis-trans isomerase D
VITSDAKPSRETTSQIYNEATAFAAAGRNNIADFDKIATEKGYALIPFNGLDRNTSALGAIKGSRKVIQWAFKNDVNVVSEVQECGDNSQYVVATVTGITPEGFRSLESVTPEIKGMLLNDKKAELIIADLKGKKMDDLAALAAEIAVEKVDTAMAVNFTANNFGRAGFEPEAIVQSVYGEKDKTGAPVKGRNGVIVPRVFNQFKNETPFDVKVEKMNMASVYMNSIYRAEEALFDGAEVVDNRYRFY